MKLTLSQINFLNTIVVVITFSVIMSSFIYKFTDTLYLEKIEELKKSYYNTNKAIIKNEVQRALKRTEAIKNIIYKNNQRIIKEKVEYIHQLLSSDTIKNTELLLQKYKKDLHLLNSHDRSRYIYIFDKKGKFLYYGGDKKLAQKSVYELGKSNKEFATFIENALSSKTSFGSYKWNNPDAKKDELQTKYVYVKKDLHHEIYIAVGVYKSSIDKEIEKLIFSELKEDHFGNKNNGYYWIVGLDKIMRMHPELEGKNIDYLSTLDGKNLADVIIKKALDNGGYLEYNWIDPDTKELTRKISYVKQLAELNLVIGAGFYFHELDEMLHIEQKNLEKTASQYLEKINFIILFLIIVVLLISRFIFVKIRAIENEKEEQLLLLEQYRILLDESSLVSRSDKNGVITYVNGSFEKVSGYRNEEIIGNTHALIKHQDTPKSQFQNLWNTIINGDIWKGILKNKRKNGESYYASVTIIPIKNKEGTVLRYISSSIDITKHVKDKTKLKNLFKTDSLTGLGNRVSLLNYITKNNTGVLALITIDRFKEINDSYGHKIGDDVIIEFGNRLFSYFKEKSYFLYRVQADVFAIVNNEDSDELIENNIKKFMKTVGHEKYSIDQENFFITYTCGIASNQTNLFAYADIALQEAKNKKCKIIHYDPSLKNIEHFKSNIQWVDRLNKAIREDKIVPHFQPIFNYKTGKIDKYEALMRISEDDTILYPNSFLDIAKKTKLYPELTYKMIKKVLDKFSTNDLEFSLNLCIEDLMNNELTTFLYEYAKKKNVFKRMVLEIVESEGMEDNSYIYNVIKKFKQEGTKLAIDDFGSGYSNYEYLISLQADFIKIDGSITKLIKSDKRTLDVIKSISEFAAKSDIKVIVEFVSDKEIDTILREIGVDYAQGFYYGKPQAQLL